MQENHHHQKSPADRFFISYADNHVTVFECWMCREQMRFTANASITTIGRERSAHVCKVKQEAA